MDKEVNWDQLTTEQKEFVLEYKRIHSKLNNLRDKMDVIKDDIREEIKKLEDLRKKENKLFNNGEK